MKSKEGKGEERGERGRKNEEKKRRKERQEGGNEETSGQRVRRGEERGFGNEMALGFYKKNHFAHERCGVEHTHRHHTRASATSLGPTIQCPSPKPH